MGGSGNVGSNDSLPWSVSSEVAGTQLDFHHVMKNRLRIAKLCVCAAVLGAAAAVRAQNGDFVVMAPPEPTSQPAQQGGKMVTVQGVVTNAATGAPLERALVMSFGRQMRAVLTDNEGRFEFRDIPEGERSFAARKPGYEADNSSDEEMTPIQVNVTDSTPEVHLSLSPKNSIYGHVTLSSGMPSQGIRVSLLRKAIQDGRAVWMRDDARSVTFDGSFRFGGLRDGTYMVQTMPEFENEGAMEPACAAGAPEEMPGYAAVFSNGSAALSGAEQIKVAAGQSTEVNLGLVQTKFHRVRIALAKPAGQEWQLIPTLHDGAGQQVDYPLRVEKTQLCVYLPDGAYMLMVRAQRMVEQQVSLSFGSQRVRTVQRSGELAGVLEFNVDGKPINQRLVLTQTGTTPVQVHYSPGPPKPLTTGAQGREDGGGTGPSLFLTAMRINSVGVNLEGADAVSETEYEIGPAAPGSYWISVVMARQGVCVGAVTSGGQNLGSTPWVVRGTATGMPIDVEIRTDCAKLTIEPPSLPETGDTGQRGTVFVYAVPDGDTATNPTGMQLSLSGNQPFTIENLTPGQYRVYAFRSQKQLEFRSPGAMERFGAGQEVTLEPNGAATLMLENVQP
jgi:Carboxypeptidase regulatory-like domain